MSLVGFQSDGHVLEAGLASQLTTGVDVQGLGSRAAIEATSNVRTSSAEPWLREGGSSPVVISPVVPPLGWMGRTEGRAAITGVGRQSAEGVPDDSAGIFDLLVGRRGSGNGLYVIAGPVDEWHVSNNGSGYGTGNRRSPGESLERRIRRGSFSRLIEVLLVGVAREPTINLFTTIGDVSRDLSELEGRGTNTDVGRTVGSQKVSVTGTSIGIGIGIHGLSADGEKGRSVGTSVVLTEGFVGRLSDEEINISVSTTNSGSSLPHGHKNLNVVW